MKYDVTLYGPGGYEVVTVEAEGGDEASTLAFRAGWVVKGIHPNTDPDEPTPEAPRRGRPPKAADA